MDHLHSDSFCKRYERELRGDYNEAKDYNPPNRLSLVRETALVEFNGRISNGLRIQTITHFDVTLACISWPGRNSCFGQEHFSNNCVRTLCLAHLFAVSALIVHRIYDDRKPALASRTHCGGWSRHVIVCTACLCRPL